MDDTLSAGEVQEAGTPPRGFLSWEQIGHRSHGGTGLLSAAAFIAAPVLRTATITEVAEGLSDGDGVELSSPNVSGIPQCNHGDMMLWSIEHMLTWCCGLLDTW